MINDKFPVTREFEGFEWPDGKKCAVMLTWHVDAESGIIAEDEEKRNHLAAISESRYGVRVGVPAILEVLSRNEIPATFFVPGAVAEWYPALMERIVGGGHEIGHHGYLHENVFGMSIDKEEEILLRARDSLIKHTGKAPAGWAAPFWGVNPHTPVLLKRHGFLYDNSLMEHHKPYFLETSEGDLVELPISLVLDDSNQFLFFPVFGTVMNTARHGFDTWIEEFEGLREAGGIFTLIEHPNVTGRPGKIRMLQNLIDHMRQYDDIWFATGAEIAGYCKGRFGHS